MSLKRKKSPVSPERGQIIVIDEQFVFAVRILEVRIKKIEYLRTKRKLRSLKRQKQTM